MQPFSFFRTIRIEFNHKHLEYFTEIDGVSLQGVKYVCEFADIESLSDKDRFNRSRQLKGPIQRKLESVKFKPVTQAKHEDVLRDFLMKDLENFITEINDGVRSANVPDEQNKFTLEKMPVSDR